MARYHNAAYFFGGAFLANAVPHSVSGLTGRSFQTPFATPPAEGLSSATVNVLWGAFNVGVGYVLVCRVGAFDSRRTSHAISLASGALAMALILARQFGRFHGGNSQQK